MKHPRLLSGLKKKQMVMACLPKRRGFTLIEMLLVVTIFSVVAASSFTLFSMGMKMWKRSQGDSLHERRALLALEKMGRDLRQSIRTHTKGFSGEGRGVSLSIPSIVTQRADKKEILQYGLIHYTWDPGKKTLCRGESTAAMIQQKKKAECRSIAEKITRFRLEYFLYDGIGEKYSWYDEWDEEDLPPRAVRVQMEVLSQEKTKQGAKKFYKTVIVPTGGKHQNDPVEKGGGMTITTQTPTVGT